LIVDKTSGRQEKRDDLFYIVIDNLGRICPVASWNMVTMIDDEEKTITSISQSIGSIASLLVSSSSEGMIHIVPSSE